VRAGFVELLSVTGTAAAATAAGADSEEPLSSFIHPTQVTPPGE